MAKERIKVGNKVFVPSCKIEGTKLFHVVDSRKENVYGLQILTLKHVNKDITLTVPEEKVLSLEECYEVYSDQELIHEIIQFKK